MSRLFIAVNLPQSVKDQIQQLRHDDDLAVGRWVKPHQLHLTLRFLGETSAERQQEVESALAEVNVPSFEMVLGGLGQFPVKGRPNVLWVGVDNTPELRALHQGVTQALQKIDYPPEERRFHPHVTLARFKVKPRWGIMTKYLQAHANFHTPPFTVTQFVLYASELNLQGSIYTEEAVYPLN